MLHVFYDSGETACTTLFRRLAILPYALAVALLATLTGAPADTVTYRIDTGHSDVSFRIRHMMSRTTGTFNEWAGTITTDPVDWSTASVDVTIQAVSIDTRHARRDADIRSDNFFDVETWPTIRFKSRKVEANGAALAITGDRLDYGVKWNRALEGGGALLGDEVEITINIEGIRM